MRRSTNRFRARGAGHWAAPFVLAMLCLRALVPAGFMLAPADGRLDLVLCDSQAPGAVHHHGGHDHSQHHHNHADPTCPYAQSAGPAPIPTLPAVAAPRLAAVPVPPKQFAQIHSQFGPSRQQSPRGPPRLA